MPMFDILQHLLYFLVMIVGAATSAFWLFAVKGFRDPCICKGQSKVQRLVRHKLYLWVLRLHANSWVCGISFASAFAFLYLLIAYRGTVDNFNRDSALIAGGALLLCGIFSLKGAQGLYVRLTNLISLSFDQRRYLSIHLVWKNYKLGRSLISSLLMSVAQQVEALRVSGVRDRIKLQSWLFAPKANAKDIEELTAAISLWAWVSQVYGVCQPVLSTYVKDECCVC